MKKLNLKLEELEVDSFRTTDDDVRAGTVMGNNTYVTIGLDCGTACGACSVQESECECTRVGGTCAVFGCPDTPNCSQTCETAWGCTCMEGCATVATWNCGYGCTQQESCIVGTCVIEYT
jgi:hypothetical protein